jgi:hypothetical protein
LTTEAIQGFSSRIFEQEHSPPLMANESKRTGNAFRIEFRPERELMFESGENRSGNVFQRGRHNEERWFPLPQAPVKH